MNYKVGDKVKLKPKEWLDELKRQLGDLHIHPDAYKNAGSEQTILECYEDLYRYDASSVFWHESYFEGLVEEETKPKDMGEVSDGYHTFNELYEYRMLYNAALFNEFAKQGLYDVHKSRKHSDGEYPFGDSNWFIVMAELPTGQISNHYEIKDWDKFQIPEKPLANKWDGHTPKDVTERLTNFTTPKKEYPKTYEECLSVLKIKGYDIVTYVPSWTAYEKALYQKVLKLRELIICRDAYWKIAGEEMGLSGSWKPDFASCKSKYAITYYNNVVSRYSEVDYDSTILVFPTEEMREAFYENFKELIEQCKELL